MPKVSIVIPIYNVEKYLRECLDSVVNQTLKDIEIICVNDGSKDKSLEIINEYAQNDKRIVVINKANSGYGDSMNKGIEAAHGEYIGIVEPDDYIELNMYEVLYNCAKEQNIDFVKTDFYTFFENKECYQISLDETNQNYNKIINPQENLAPYFFSKILGTWSGIYKKEFLDKNNIRYNNTPGARYQDQGFWWQTLLRAQKTFYLNIPFYHYRQTAANSSNNPNGFFWIIKEFEFIEKFVNTDNRELARIFNTFKLQHYLFNFYKMPKKDKLEHFDILHKEFTKQLSQGLFDFNLLNNNEKEQFALLQTSSKKFKEQFYTPFLHKIFSVKNQGNYKVLRLFGVKFKIKNKWKMLQDEIFDLKEAQLDLKEAQQRYSNDIKKDLCELIPRYLSVYNQHQKVFPKYKNINQGKDVVLVATGPSLVDFKPIENALYLGVNKAFQYDKVKFDYLFLQDYSGATKTYIDDFVDYRKGMTKKFIGFLNYSIYPKSVIPDKHSNSEDVERYYTYHPEEKNDFVYDISTQPFGDAYSIVFPAMQFLLWTNPKRIYLVGCDCSLDGYHYSKEKNNLATQKVIEGWKRMKEFANVYYPDTEIISINPVGLKGLFRDIH